MKLQRITYPRRLFVWLLGYSLLMMGWFVTYQYHREKVFKAVEIDSRLQIINRFILDEMAEGHPLDSISLGQFHPFEDVRISILDSRGYVIYDNTLDTLPRQNHSRREEVQKAINSGGGFAVHRLSESTGASYFYSATRGDDGRIVRTAVPYSVSLDSLLRADYGFLWSMALITLVMCLIGYFATRRIGQHVTRLNQFAKRVEEGGKISDMEPFPDDELGQISSHIVRLYGNLQQANSERDREHRAALHEHREKERIKKQLTNNINHELKTPVASIQVCLETLLVHPELDRQKRDEFLERGLVHCERLRRLLADVALITRLEDGRTAIFREPLDLRALITETISEKISDASAAGINITCNLTDSIIINGNASLLTSVFSNLIDNAIAYSGGHNIVISREPSADGRITLTVADDGCGVAPEHLPRLFERFYRIDKGRSRAAGGTGLGLSIVRNAVAFHTGTITVENRPGGGLLFRITFTNS